MNDKTLVEIFGEIHKQIIPEVNDPLMLQTIYMQQMVIMMAAIDDDLKAIRTAILDQSESIQQKREDDIKNE